MSGYFYKDISINNIVVNNGKTTNVSGFSGMPDPSGGTNYSSMRPLKFGYTTGNSDLLNQYAAPNTGIITASGTTVNVPSGVKYCRVISVGGAGGGGGHGGKASATSYNGHNSTNYGGDGGIGGYGTYTYINSLSISGHNSISVTVGSGGNGGSSGNDDSKKSTYNAGNANYTNVKSNGNDGAPGNAGNSSYITLNGDTTTHLAVAPGGNGGGGGNGAWANATESGHNGGDGNAGAYGNSTTAKSNDPNYPILSNYGIPSNVIAKDGGGQATGGNGTQGAVQIIWLYD